MCNTDNEVNMSMIFDNNCVEGMEAGTFFMKFYESS